MDEERIKRLAQLQFSQNAEKYVTSPSHAQGSDLKLLVEWLRPQPDWVALDVATGGGHVAKALSPHVAHVFATDLTPQMLANTARHLTAACRNIWYVVADAEGLPFLDGTFDLITCRIAAHHFPRPDRFVREAARVLKPGGLFLLIDNVAPADKELAAFMNTFERLRDESHARCLGESEWRALFAEAGLVEQKSRLRKKRYDFPAWASRTAASPEQVREVATYLLAADETARSYFAVTANEETVVSLEVDEWMCLCQKA